MSGTLSIALAPLASMLLASAMPGASGFQVSFLHDLSSSFGTIPVSSPELSWDPEHREVYVCGGGLVRVFNDAGMEVYSFGQNPEVGAIVNVVAVPGGDLVALAYREGGVALVRLSFRGEYRGTIEPRGVPAEFGGKLPAEMRYQGGKIYLADLAEMRVLVLDESGAFVASYDVAAKLEVADKRAENGLRGFNVDRDGNILFTVQPLFHAYVMTPDGVIATFGQRGSAPGKFNVVGGIARDARGNFYVADMLKSAILVFDREYQFVKEFGYRGYGPGNLIAPASLAASEDKLFVAQVPRRGVSVFRIAQGPDATE